MSYFRSIQPTRKKRNDKMKNRRVIRSVFTAAFLGAVIALFSACTGGDNAEPTAPAHWTESELIDLTHSFDDETVFWPTAAGFSMTTDFEGVTEGGYYYSAYSFSTAEHGGTHLDAPIHFAEGANANDEIPLTRLIARGVMIDVSERALANRDYLVSIEDFTTWEMAHGTIPDDAIVLLRTGYGAYWPDKESYMGTAERGADAVPMLHFPGLDPEAAAWLVSERQIAAIGLDTPSIDYGQSTLYESHQTLFKAQIPAFENVASLDQLPAAGFSVIALPMKIAGGSGGPLRIVAVLD